MWTEDGKTREEMNWNAGLHRSKRGMLPTDLKINSLHLVQRVWAQTLPLCCSYDSQWLTDLTTVLQHQWQRKTAWRFVIKVEHRRLLMLFLLGAVSWNMLEVHETSGVVQLSLDELKWFWHEHIWTTSNFLKQVATVGPEVGAHKGCATVLAINTLLPFNPRSPKSSV
jgi:hypothetical protein